MSRDPDAIHREIEETRAELARTVDLIAERLSPRRAAGRGASKVKSSIDGAFHREADSAVAGSPSDETESRAVSTPPSASPTMTRTLRTDRVAMAIAGVVAMIVLVVAVRHRRRR